MTLLMQSKEHQNRAIQEVAAMTWREFTDDADVGRRLPSRIETISDRLNAQPWAVKSQLEAILHLSSESELS